MRYKLGCGLSYEIGSESTFIFNLEVAKIARQKILKESLVFTPPVELSVYADPATHNRYVGVNVAPGALNLEYNADMELFAHHADPETINETLLKRAGVCRDFSHLGIAFCRGLGIPARFVSCYAYGLVPSDFHAVFEAYLDRRWWLFDATRQAHLDGLVRIGVGRDAAEVAFSTPFGTFEPKVMDIRIAPSEGGPDQGPRTVDAVSTDEAVTSSN